jgi:hypothetical protein
MSKMSVADAAEFFGVSKEAIHNRIRRGSLNSVVENDIKYVIVDKTVSANTRVQSKKQTVSSNDKYYKLLEEQNSRLQERVDILETETRTLRDQKEQMLIDERIMIEQIYKDKDEQLKNILNSFKAQFMLTSPLEAKEEEHLEAEIEFEEKEPTKDNVISLKKYLKEQKLSAKKEQKIKKRFKKIAKEDNRIITIGKKYYLNLDKFDYRDLF